MKSNYKGICITKTYKFLSSIFNVAFRSYVQVQCGPQGISGRYFMRTGIIATINEWTSPPKNVTFESSICTCFKLSSLFPFWMKAVRIGWGTDLEEYLTCFGTWVKLVDFGGRKSSIFVLIQLWEEQVYSSLCNVLVINLYFF